MKNKMIRDFNPDRLLARKLALKRIKTFSAFMFFVLLFEIIAYTMIWILDDRDHVKYGGLILISLHIFATITFLWIYDFGASSKLKKMKFKDPDKKYTVKQGHTFYVAVRYIGFARFIINIFFILMNLIVVLIAFTV